MASEVLIKCFIRKRELYGYRIIKLINCENGYLIIELMSGEQYKLRPNDIKILSLLSDSYILKQGIIYHNGQPLYNIINGSNCTKKISFDILV